MSFDRRPFTVLIPTNLVTTSILPTGIKPAKAAKLIDGIHYFLSLLFPKPTERKKRKMLEEEGYIRLRAEILKNIIGPEYSLIINVLEEHGIIQIAKQFVLGKKTRGYRIQANYFAETRQVNITNWGLCNRHHAFIATTQKDQQERLKNLPYITKWLNQNHVSINVAAAHDFFQTYRIKMLDLWSNTPYNSEIQKQEAKFRILNRCFYHRDVVKTIDAGRLTCSRDNSGRLYSPLVSLKKELRSCVLLNGQRTGSIDIKSSQPYLFTKLLNKEFWQTLQSTPISLYKISKEKYAMLNETGILNNIITLLNSYESEYCIRLERMRFKNIEWENDFYSHVQDLIHATTADDLTLKHFANRSAVKKSVTLILFDIYERKNPPYYKGFKVLFPDELRLMDNIKKHPVKNLFPTLLQSVESKILLDHTCKEISENFPRLPILTIHDSIICDTEYLVQIKDIMEKYLEEIVGIKPGLKIENVGMDEMMENISSTVNTDWEKLFKSLRGSGNKDWVSTFNEEPKESPLRNTMVKMGGRIYLDKRMALLEVVDQINEDDYVEELDYPDEYYQGLGSEYDDQE